MSNVVAGIARRRVVGSPVIKAVLMFMCDCASDDGSGIWTSKTTMARDLEMSKRTVQNAILDLMERGIVTETGQRKCDRGYTVEYRVNIDVLEALQSTRPEPKARGAGDAPVQDVHPKGCTTFTSTGAGDAPKPSLEPSLEPSKRAREQLTLLSEEDAPKVDTVTDAFNRFWAVYPKKADKPAARKAFDRALKGGADPDLIISAARRYARWLNDARPGEFRPQVKYPQGWLTGERWNDPDLPPEAPPPRRLIGPAWGEVVR